jgi:hypothetical protein
MSLHFKARMSAASKYSPNAALLLTKTFSVISEVIFQAEIVES